MQIYKINIDTNKPITQRIAVPQDCDKYGLVVSSTTNGHPTRNLSCTIYDGDETLTPSKTLEDGSQLFIMSSIGNSSRGIRVAVSATPSVLWEAQSYDNTSGSQKLWKFNLALPAGTYYRDEFDLFGYLYNPDYVPLDAPYQQIKTSAAQIDYVNADLMVIYWADRKLECYDRATSSQAVGTLLPPDEPIRCATAATYDVKMNVPAHTSIALLPSMLGNNVNCTIDVQLDEVRGATPDGDIQLDPAVFGGVATTNLSAEAITVDGTAYAPTTITIGGTDYTILAAQTEATT